MSVKQRFKVAYVPWWRPIRLVTRSKTHGVFDNIGWVWRQRAYLVKNLNHGWMAFLEDQTEENLRICPGCGKRVPHMRGDEPE